MIFYLLYFACLPLPVISQVTQFEKCMTDVIGVQEFGRLPAFYEHQKSGGGYISFREKRMIPIVVHVLWHADDENISRLQILSQIDALNADFSANNDAVEFLPQEFADLSVDSDIGFCLADSLGGIERRYVDYDTVGWATDTAGHKVLSHWDNGGLDAWDNQYFLNVWVGRMPTGVLGYFFTEFGNISGIALDPDVFGTIGSVSKSPRNNLGKTLTHEMGHYLGLGHIFGFGCAIDDGIDDTPSQAAPTSGCPNWPEWSCESNDMYMNFMDYSDDVCLTMFTKGQIKVMHGVLENKYPLLGLNQGCILAHPTFLVRIFPNPVVDYLALQITTPTERTDVSIFGSDGRLFYHMQVATSTYLTVSTQSWASGIYFLRIMVGDQVIWKRIQHVTL